MKKYQSNAEWPDETGIGITTDTHYSYEAASGVCDILEEEGLGGDGEVFPLRTWVSNITENTMIDKMDLESIKRITPLVNKIDALSNIKKKIRDNIKCSDEKHPEGLPIFIQYGGSTDRLTLHQDVIDTKEIMYDIMDSIDNQIASLLLEINNRPKTVGI